MKRQLRLRGVSGHIDGKAWESDSLLRAGRLGTLEIVLDDSSVSRRHAEIRSTGQGWRLREVVKRYSDFIDHPIVMDVERETDGKKETKEETLNSRQAIWLRPKHEVKPEEYNAFYKQLSRDMDDPLKVIHVAAEGTLEFRALMFLPAHRAMDFLAGPEKKSGLDLYVRRVLIAHGAEELAPPYLRFVRGVVDSSDLPLNVSREHFLIEHNGSHYVLVDRQSTCGTLVEGTLVGGKQTGGAVRLRDGDVIIVGSSASPYVFKFRAR